jgi:alkaline phosphatase D
MLGKAQKAWWKSTMQGSDATWKLWGNEVPMMRMLVKSVGITLPANPPVTNPLGFDRVLDGDAWDGYGVERAELLTFLRTANVKNVVVLTGDIHAHFAGVLKDNFDAPANLQTTVATELIVAGISSNSLFSFYEAATRAVDPGLRSFVTVDAAANGGTAFTENLNLLVTKGLLSAAVFAGAIGQGAPIGTALAAANAQADATINTHLRYVDTNAQGYGYIKVTEAECAAQLITINRPVGGASVLPGVKRVAAFTIPKDNPNGMSQAEITGTKPFPLT